MQSKRADIRIINSETLSDNWYNLKKYTFDLQRSDGDWQRQEREVYDRGNGATILLYNRDSKTVILTRQFRFPVFINGHEEDLIEAAAGLLDNLDPESRIKAEAEEETGYKVTRVEKIFEAYMSPGSVTEKLYFYLAEYHPQDRTSAGGGVKAEGEDIDVLEMTLDDALRGIEQVFACAILAEHLNMEMRKWPTGILLCIYNTAQNAHVPPLSYWPGCRLLT